MVFHVEQLETNAWGQAPGRRTGRDGNEGPEQSTGARPVAIRGATRRRFRTTMFHVEQASVARLRSA